MVFRFIDNVILNLNMNLEVLTKDSNVYSTLLYQHKGTFSAEATRFGNETDCSNKFNSFLTLAKNENVALAVTPEYSCPWNSIEWLLMDESRWPNNRKLWAICCESITPAQITDIREKYTSDEIYFHYDSTAFQNGNGVFLDPLCYFFKAPINGRDKLVVLIQFKTQHMGVWDNNIEQEKYIWGNEIYILRNSVNSVFLFSNICSEAVEFKIDENFQQQTDNRWDDSPYIILNPQMNPKPSHGSFKSYRKTILSYNLKDLISLNWGAGTMFSGSGTPLIPYSKSSMIIKSSEVEYTNEARFINNHKKGLYYLLRKPNVQVNYLNPNVDIFLISNQKPSSAGVNQALVRRIGPEVRNIYIWDAVTEAFSTIQSIDDGFITFLDSLNCINAICHDPDASFIYKERLINLSSGQIISKKEDRRWYNIDKLESVQQDGDEAVKRFTYVYDEGGVDSRTKYVEVLDILNTQILTDQNLFPPNISSFVNNCTEIMFINNDGYNYRYNLATVDGNRKATVAYIGRKDEAMAKRILKQLQSIFDNDDQSKKMVVVWYKSDANTILPLIDTTQPKVTDDPSTEPTSISNS